MLKRALMLSLFALILCGSLITAQYDRDEVLQITYPTTGTVIDADTMVVTFNIGSYFTLGDTGCTDCDGYIAATLNDLPVGQIYAAQSFISISLSASCPLLELIIKRLLMPRPLMAKTFLLSFS